MSRKQYPSLAWIGHPAAAPRLKGHTVSWFEDSDDFLLAPQAFDFGFYVLHLSQRGVRGTDLVRLIRKRSNAGLLALGDPMGEDFVAALEAGADMVLPPDLPPARLEAAIAAVNRRAQSTAPAPLADSARPWMLFEARSLLQAPDGTLIPLTASDRLILACFADAAGGQVPRETLTQRLWGSVADDVENSLHAVVYRLRKRIERSGQPIAPVQAVAKVGYEFRAPLVRG